MSYVDTAYQGLAALDKRNWDDAITKLSTALASSPNPAWLIARSKALVGVARFREALEDADLAWHEASRRSKRELIIEAQHRRAVAYNRLGELANADACCVYATEMLDGGKATAAEDPAAARTDAGGFWTVTLADAQRDAKEKEGQNKSGGSKSGSLQSLPTEATEKLKKWRLVSALRLQILHKMEQLAADDSARRPTTSQKPPAKELAKFGSDQKSASKEAPVQTESPAASSAPTSTPPAPKNEKLRLQDFQSGTTMSVSIFSKGNDKTKLNIQFNPFEVVLDPIVYPNGEQKQYTLATWGEIVPEECKYTVTPSKVELQLKKKNQGKWATLEFEGNADEAAQRQTTTSSTSEQPQTAAAGAGAAAQPSVSESKPKDAEQKPSEKSGPSYPTSSRGGPKNWDNIEVDSDEEESDVNAFFKKLYKNSTPEQQRAMMKSFTESSGTSLSTDWDDVKGRTVETVPPEGVEAKKWE